MKIEIKGAGATIRDLYIRFSKERNRLISAKTTEIIEDLKRNTPIDTGLARASWENIDTVEGAIIRNNVSYIEQLNSGSSKQAPAFFVEKTLLKHGKPVGQLVKINPS
jgi:hypothetical protein